MLSISETWTLETRFPTPGWGLEHTPVPRSSAFIIPPYSYPARRYTIRTQTQTAKGSAVGIGGLKPAELDWVIQPPLSVCFVFLAPLGRVLALCFFFYFHFHCGICHLVYISTTSRTRPLNLYLFREPTTRFVVPCLVLNWHLHVRAYVKQTK